MSNDKDDFLKGLFESFDSLVKEGSSVAVKSIRVSRSSFRHWELHGPIDQALKTTLQAEAVRVVPITISVHGQPVTLELWVNALELDMEDIDDPRRLNMPAMAIVQRQSLRDKGIADPGEIRIKDIAGLLHVDPILGPVILTGAGGTDLPDIHPECLVNELLGLQGDEDRWEDS